jgi:hypothetical protein
MEAGKVLHVMHAEKFIEPFIEFVEDNFDDFECRHIFFVWGDVSKFCIKSRFNLRNSNKRRIDQLKYVFSMAAALQKAEKIILHGLFVRWHLMLLSLMPWNLKKCYWVIWGGDLYTYKLSKRSLGWWKSELFRRFVIKRIGHFITHIEGDYNLAQQWYGAKGEWHECFMYPSNLYQESTIRLLPHESINIILGNSADSSNNHIDALNKLKCYSGENIKIYCPLSYGDQLHAQMVADYGRSLFGEKFIPLREFMPLEKYNELLAKIDIAIFNHKRQQGMGNITTLLGVGAKVYLSSAITTWEFLWSLGLKVFDVSVIDLSPIESKISKRNALIASEYFSRGNLISQLSSIFGKIL